MSSTATPGPSHSHEHVHPGLEVQVERKGTAAEVRVVVAPEELDRARQREFATLAKRVRVKGFRPGKAPRAMLEKQFGGEVERGVLEHFVQHAYQTAVEEHKLRPAAYPRIQLDEALPARGAPWKVTFEVLLRPEFELGDIEGLEVEAQPVAVDEAELERALAEIRRANSRAVPAGEAGLAAEGVAVATLDFFRPGSSASCLSREGMRLSPRNAPGGIDPRSFEEALVGAKAGEERSMEFEFPANFPIEEARGEKGTVRFSFRDVLQVIPPADAEVFQAFEVTDEAGLREAVRARMLGAKQEAEEQRIESELLERVIEAHPMELPERLVQDQVEAHREELRAALEKQGLSAEEAATRAEAESGRERANAEKGLKAIYLIEEIARAKELRVEEQDIRAELASIAQRNETSVDDVAKYYRDKGLLRQLGLEIMERKVRRYLRASAAVRASRS